MGEFSLPGGFQTEIMSRNLESMEGHESSECIMSKPFPRRYSQNNRMGGIEDILLFFKLDLGMIWREIATEVFGGYSKLTMDGKAEIAKAPIEGIEDCVNRLEYGWVEGHESVVLRISR